VSIRLISGLFAFFFLMQTASAEEITPWNFRGQMPKEAQGVQLTSAQITPQGLHINTQTDGYLVWSGNPIEGPVHVITIRAKAARPTQGSVLWQAKDAKEGELVQLYFAIPASNEMKNIDVIVSGYDQWNWRSEQFAIAFPAGSEVVIEEIQFRYWPFYERAIERWKSFWTFDSFRPYSINFLWGPLLAGNSPQRTTLFDTLPPSAPSVTRYFYVVLAIVAVASIIAGRKQWRRDKAIGWFLGTFVLLWLIFDVRMGAEILSYAANDVKTYVFAEQDDRQLRNFQFIHATVERMVPELQKHATFAMVTPQGEVYFPILRYYAYPSVILPDPATWSGATAWAVIDRNDIWVDEASRLREGPKNGSGKILTPPGHVAVPVNDSTFLFVVP
jgi:hypothetical protein